MSSLSLVFDVLATDRASEVFHRIGNAAGDAGKKVEESTTNVNNAGSKLAAGVGIAAAAVAVASVKMAGDFQASTTRLVTSANETQGNLDMVRKGLLDMAGQVGYSVEELAKAMYKVESGGQHGADGLMVLKAAAQGAKTENADLTTVADAVTSAMQDYHLKATDAADVTSKLVAATASGKMTFQELAGSMAAILPTASANHIALNDILGDLASMTVHGMSAEQASQNMADAIRHLAGSSQMSTHELALLGFTAQQVSRDLSTKGLSGTVQELSEAVLKNMGPGTSEVVLQLGAALNGLSPAVRDLGMKLMDGTISQADYVKAAKQLAPELQGQAAQFATLAKATHGIGNEQMSGSQVMLSYSGAMKALMGDATGMNVALMLTGENTKTTTTAIENITKATADAKGNVQGWDLIQGNFNQKLDEAKGHMQAMAIQLGTHLLPALTSTLDFINTTVLPGLEHLGSAVATAAKWFVSLPAPIKDAALAFAALKAVDMLGWFDKLGNGIVYARVVMSEFGDSVRGSMGKVSGAFREAKAASAFIQTLDGGQVNRLSGSLDGLGAAAGQVAKGGFATMRSAGSGLISMLGGPWAVGLMAATAGVAAINQRLEEAAATVQRWMAALANGGAIAAEATRQMDAQAAELKKNDEGFGGLINKITGYSAVQRWAAPDSEKSIKSFRDQYKAMTDLQQTQHWVTQATYDLNMALKDGDPTRITHARDELQRATKDLAYQTDRANDAQKTQNQLLNEAATRAMGAVSASLGQRSAMVQLQIAIEDYGRGIRDGTLDSLHLQQAQFGLVDSARAYAQMAGDAATAQAKANHVQDDGTIGQQAYRKALEEAATMMSGPARDAVLSLAKSLDTSAESAHMARDAAGNLITRIGEIPNSHNTDITADATQANATIDQFMRDVQAKGFVGAVFNVGSPTGGGGGMGPSSQRAGLPPIPGHATGGWTGPGSKYTPVGIVHADEFVFTKEQTNKAGVQNLYAMAAALNGYSGGGLVQQMSYPFDFSPSMKSGAADYLKSLTPQYQVGAGAEQWRGLVDQVLAMLGLPIRYDNGVLHMIQMESGGDPNAINLTDSNAMAGHPSQGLMQTIPSTFAAYAGPFASRSITDPLASIYAGTNYALQTYGPDMIAAGGRQGSGGGYIGYDNGGLLQPGITMAYNGTGKPETIRTAEQEAALHKSGGQFTGTLVLDSGEFLGVVHGAIDSADHALANDVHYGRG